MKPGEINHDLFALLEQYAPVGSTVATVSSGASNLIVALDRTGVDVETDRTKDRSTGPQRVPAWMIEAAWQRLVSQGRLTNKELLATDDLNVKRSSFVCALLATLPEVEVVSTRPVVLRLTRK